MTVLVVETRGGGDTATAACEALAGVVDVARCADSDLDTLLDNTPMDGIDVIVVACNGDADAGHRVCRSVRSVTTAMLAMLTSSRREADELLAFARGCDDYITTSSSPEVVRARLQGLVARTGRHRAGRTVEFGALRIDPSMRAVTVDGAPVELTRTEFDLLHALVAQQRRVIPRRELLEIGWQGCPPNDHVLDVHLSRLRRKVLQAGGPRIGVPVPGVGYRIGSPAAPALEVVPPVQVPGDPAVQATEGRPLDVEPRHLPGRLGAAPVPAWA